MKVALVCTRPALAWFIMVDNGFGLATVKQEENVSAWGHRSDG